jgi:hypothetical protein
MSRATDRRGSTVHQTARVADQRPGRKGRQLKSGLYRVCGDARSRYALPWPSEGRRHRAAGHLAKRRRQLRHSCDATVCCDASSRPCRRPQRHLAALEQRSDGGPDKPAQNAKARNVWTRRHRVTPRQNAPAPCQLRSHTLSQTHIKCARPIFMQRNTYRRPRRNNIVDLAMIDRLQAREPQIPEW